MNRCNHCDKETKNPKFCSSSCAASHNNRGKVKNGKPKGNCLMCGGKLRDSETKYCSVKCMQEFTYNEFISEWKANPELGTRKTGLLSGYVKRYIRDKYNSKCAICGWNETNTFTGKIPLEIEHRDGNHLNNSEENLILLCPNCHSLTPTYKGANRGNGRKYRRKVKQ